MSNPEPLLALFKSYEHILSNLRVRELAQTRISGEATDCERCGMCCAFMRPGPVSFRTWGKWQREGALIADFFEAFGNEDHPAYHCWYFTGVRLLMCPLLLRSVVDRKTFCAVYHMGSTQRHPACSTYRPNPPLCRATAYSLEN
jgi:hypothetical protein